MANYRKCTVALLVTMAADGDKEAVVELLLSRFRNNLAKVARSVDHSLTDDDLADVLQNFTERNIIPDTKGQWRLRGLANEHNPEAYIATCLRNYMRDTNRKEHLDFVDRAPEEGRTPSGDGSTAQRNSPDQTYTPEDIHPKTQKELQIHAIFNALERIDDMTPRERYILLTFLLGERYRGNGAKPLKLREELGEQLDENPSTIFNRYSTLKGVLRARAAEILRNINSI